MSPFLCLMLLTRVAAELGTPSNLLGPRHYNHHAYEQYLKEVEPTKVTPLTNDSEFNHQLTAASDINRQGPVLFPNDAPPPPRPPLIVTSRPLIDSVARSELNNTIAEQSVVNNQFQPFGRVGRLFQPKQYDYEEPHTALPPIYRAISDHASQNLRLHKAPKYKTKEPDYPRRYESNNINNDDNSDYNQAQNYAFSYIVRDHKTGDDFSHSQQSSGSATNGEYRVRLPDGRMQIVSYTADENGYNANVRYDDEKAENSIDHELNRNYNKDYNNQNANYNGNQNSNNQNLNYNGNQNPNYNVNQNSNYNVNQNPNYNINQNSNFNVNQNLNVDYKDGKYLNHNYNIDYKDNKYDLKNVNDITRNSYVQNEETKPVTEQNYKDDYNQYADSKEYYGNDYSLEYDDKYNNYDPHKSKFTAFSGPKSPKLVPRKSYGTASTVRPSYDELKPLFVQKKPFKTPLPTTEYLYSNIPIDISVPSTTPSPYFDATTTERVVIIGTTKPNFYTNIRNSIPPISVTPVPKFSTPFAVTTPRSFLASTIATISNLKKNIDFSGVRPVLTNTFIDKINKYLSYN